MSRRKDQPEYVDSWWFSLITGIVVTVLFLIVVFVMAEVVMWP